MRIHNAREAIGEAIGAILAPLTALGSRLRHARLFHPTGIVCAAQVVPVAWAQELQPLAQRLAGGAIVRLSGALWKHEDAPDLLGCAIRFRGPRALLAETPGAAPGTLPHLPELATNDQDLLFATMRSFLTALPAMLRTRRHDYLQNVYYALGTFEALGVGTVELRLVPAQAVPSVGDTRRQRLIHAIRRGAAELRLELRHHQLGAAWQPLCELHLLAALELAGPLHFSPHNTGVGLRPRGAIHAMRRAPYEASQRARDAVLGDRRTEELTEQRTPANPRT
jgi:hypothetical protein